MVNKHKAMCYIIKNKNKYNSNFSLKLWNNFDISYIFSIFIKI